MFNLLDYFDFSVIKRENVKEISEYRLLQLFFDEYLFLKKQQK